MRQTKVTVRAIAEAIGVSIGTVSLALKGLPGPSDKTRERVLNASRALGYDTGRLRKNQPKKILVISRRALIQDIRSNHFYARVLHGAEVACSEHEVALSLQSVASPEDIKCQIQRHQPDALLLLGRFDPDALNAMRERGVPIAIALDSHPQFRCVIDDDFRGALLATQHLIDTGARRLAMIVGAAMHGSFDRRIKGFRSALYQAGIPADPDLEIRLVFGIGYENACREGMRRLLAMSERPDAVFAYNDDSALHAIAVCTEAGIRVPEDMRIAGYDDVALARLSKPSLTSVRVDLEALGRETALALIEGRTEPGDVLMPVELVVRESTGLAFESGTLAPSSTPD